MSAILDQACFETSLDFESARSRLLDRFFELEVAVTKWLRYLGEVDTAKPLGQRLSQLANHENLSSKAKRNQAKFIIALESDCAFALKIRNAAVHCRHEPGTKAGEPCALLITVEHALDEGHNRFVVTRAEFDQATSDAKRIASRLTHFLNQASSPPRPSPGAAAGP